MLSSLIYTRISRVTGPHGLIADHNVLGRRNVPVHSSWGPQPPLPLGFSPQPCRSRAGQVG